MSAAQTRPLARDEQHALALAQVLECVRRNPGNNRTQIASRLCMRAGRTLQLLDELATRGEIQMSSGKGMAKRCYVPEALPCQPVPSAWESENAGDHTRMIGRIPVPAMEYAILECRRGGSHTLADRLTTLRDAWARAVERTAAVEDVEPPQRLEAAGGER